jgi:regulator of CtrA degradation
MMDHRHQLTPKLIEALYTEAMVLADEARSYFDCESLHHGLSPEVSVAFSCESLKVTTRLMHSIAWLLDQKAIAAGEIPGTAQGDARHLGYAPASDPFQVGRFPEDAQALIASSEDLYFRLQRFSGKLSAEQAEVPAPLAMMERIRASF